jgi:hypothetical protein
MKKETWLFSQALSGSSFTNLIRCVHQAKWSITPRYWLRFLVVLMATLLFAPLAMLEAALYRRQIAAHQLADEPIFILGHWRSGTTFLHSLMAQDKQWGYFNTFYALLLRIAKLSEGVLKPVAQIALPSKRPMDDVALNMDYPQEEEFALTNHQGLSFYLMMHFPRYLLRYLAQYVAINDAPQPLRQAWKDSYRTILQKTSWLNHGRRLVMKNPPNTARVALLLELYPNAKFIYIHRDPAELYFSTQRTLAGMMGVFQLHSISKEEIEEDVLQMYPCLMQQFLQQQSLIPRDNFCALSYQQLKSQPQQAMAFIYDRLKLPDYDKAKENFATYLQSQRDYKTAKYSLAPEVQEKLERRWGEVQRQHEAWLASLGDVAMR